MTIHSMYVSRGRLARPTSRQFSRSPFATARRQRVASTGRESESGMSIKPTDVSV